MNIGILTLHNSTNYGAVLQAFSLCQFIARMRHNVEIVDYLSNRFKGIYSPRLRPGSILKGEYLSDIIRYWRFKEFNVHNSIISKDKFSTKADIAVIGKRYDVIIIGSDQVWNSVIMGDDLPVYTEPFADGTARIITYAPSFGSSLPPEDKHSLFKNALSRYSHISTREKLAKGFLEKLSDKDITQVVDPTLLLDPIDYENLIKKARKFECITAYTMGQACSSPYFLSKLQKRMAMRVYPIRGYVRAGQVVPFIGRYLKGLGFQRSPAPLKWLDMVMHSKGVFTESFHGTIFSIMGSTPFVVCSRDTRIMELLDSLELSERLIDEPDPDRAARILNEPVDFSKAHQRMRELRVGSIRFLREALS